MQLNLQKNNHITDAQIIFFCRNNDAENDWQIGEEKKCPMNK